MTDWATRARDEARFRWTVITWGMRAARQFWDAFAQGAMWQRMRMLDRDTITRAARALNEAGWTDGWCEPEEYDTCDDCRNSLDQAARAALTAAIGDDGE